MVYNSYGNPRALLIFHGHFWHTTFCWWQQDLSDRVVTGFYQKRQVNLLTLQYFELISPAPVYIPKAGHIVSPTLKQIADIGLGSYNYYLSILLMDARSFFSMLGQAAQFDALSDEEKQAVNIFDLLTSSQDTAGLLCPILNFFLTEQVQFSEADRCFLVSKDSDSPVTGIISKENYMQVYDVIFQRNYVKQAMEDVSKAQSKKAMDILKKLQKGRAQKRAHTKSDKTMELGNIISAVANRHPSLNLTNIWDLTVYQLWDSFARISNNSIYDIQSMSVAAWGNKDNRFDAASWFKRMDTDN